jgi:replicative DNA helicase
MTEEATHSKSGGRVPPQDIEAEKSLLGAILISDGALPEILTILKPRDFYEERHQMIFEAMINLYDQHKPVDLLTVTTELRTKKQLKDIGGAPYLTELSNFVPAATHAKAYAEIIEKASTRRRLIKAGNEIANKAFEEDADVQSLIGSAEKELFDVSDKVVKSDYVAMDELLADAFDRIEELHKNKGALRGLKTGFRDLDKKTAGFQKGDLIIIGARPAMGKTTFAQNLTYNIASMNKKGVLFFSMEMAANEIVDRMISDVSGVDNWKMRTGNLTDDEFQRIGEALG